MRGFSKTFRVLVSKYKLSIGWLGTSKEVKPSGSDDGLSVVPAICSLNTNTFIWFLLNSLYEPNGTKLRTMSLPAPEVPTDATPE